MVFGDENFGRMIEWKNHYRGSVTRTPFGLVQLGRIKCLLICWSLPNKLQQF